jgi:hypothetical protein
MKLNIKFEDHAEHAWLFTNDATELFIKRKMSDLQVVNGNLACWVPSEMAEEIEADSDRLEIADGPDYIFLCCQNDRETRLYSVTEAIVEAGGDILMLVQPMATIHQTTTCLA